MKTDFEYRVTVYPDHAIIEGSIPIPTWVGIIDLLIKHEGFSIITHNNGNGSKLVKKKI